MADVPLKGVSGDALEILDVPELQVCQDEPFALFVCKYYVKRPCVIQHIKDGWHKWSPDAVAAKAYQGSFGH